MIDYMEPVCAGNYVGIFYSASVFGPVVSYIGGGFLLKLYTDFDRVDMSTSVHAFLHCISMN